MKLPTDLNRMNFNIFGLIFSEKLNPIKLQSRIGTGTGIRPALQNILGFQFAVFWLLLRSQVSVYLFLSGLTLLFTQIFRFSSSKFKFNNMCKIFPLLSIRKLRAITLKAICEFEICVLNTLYCFIEIDQ